MEGGRVKREGTRRGQERERASVCVCERERMRERERGREGENGREREARRNRKRLHLKPLPRRQGRQGRRSRHRRRRLRLALSLPAGGSPSRLHLRRRLAGSSVTLRGVKTRRGTGPHTRAISAAPPTPSPYLPFLQSLPSDTRKAVPRSGWWWQRVDGTIQQQTSFQRTSSSLSSPRLTCEQPAFIKIKAGALVVSQ